MKKLFVALLSLSLLTPAFGQTVGPRPSSSSGGSGTLTALTPLTSVPKSANYPTVAGDLGKSIDVTTGSGADVTTTLVSAATAGNGGLQWIAKIDSGTKKVIVTDGVTAQAWLSAQNDTVVMRSNGSSWAPYWYSIAPRTDYFASSGTWTKPPLAKTLYVTVIGGGGGGASGAQAALAVNSSGGAGGNAGAISWLQNLPASLYGSTETVTVGVGGAGGAVQATPSTAGNAGTVPSASSFSTGTIAVKTIAAVTAPTGGQIAGAAAVGSVAFGRQTSSNGGAGANGAAGAPTVQNSSGFTISSMYGGGSGAGTVAVTSVNLNGGATGGSQGGWWGDTPAVGGIASTKTNPTTGTGGLWETGLRLGASGGGGWAASDGTAGGGAVGLAPGGAGGGGGSSVDGASSGAGGNGADGGVQVITRFND